MHNFDHDPLPSRARARFPLVPLRTMSRLARMPLLHALVYAAVACCAGAPIYGNEQTFDVDLVCFLLFLSFYKYFSLLIIFNYCMYFKNQGLRFV